MTGSQLAITLSLYIISLALALILSILKKKATGRSRIPIIIHVILFVFFIISKILSPLSFLSGYIFLIFFCSGIITGGYLFRSGASLILQAYFFLYLLSIVVFIYSPSLLVGMISLNATKTDKSASYHLAANFFLEEQRSLLNDSDTSVQYKITQQFGIFHKTLARDIRFGKRIDSLKVLSFNPEFAADLRGYLNIKSTNLAGPDSLDLHIKFNTHQDERIQKKK